MHFYSDLVKNIIIFFFFWFWFFTKIEPYKSARDGFYNGTGPSIFTSGCALLSFIRSNTIEHKLCCSKWRQKTTNIKSYLKKKKLDFKKRYKATRFIMSHVTW